MPAKVQAAAQTALEAALPSLLAALSAEDAALRRATLAAAAALAASPLLAAPAKGAAGAFPEAVKALLLGYSQVRTSSRVANPVLTAKDYILYLKPDKTLLFPLQWHRYTKTSTLFLVMK